MASSIDMFSFYLSGVRFWVAMSIVHFTHGSDMGYGYIPSARTPLPPLTRSSSSSTTSIQRRSFLLSMARRERSGLSPRMPVFRYRRGRFRGRGQSNVLLPPFSLLPPPPLLQRQRQKLGYATRARKPFPLKSFYGNM